MKCPQCDQTWPDDYSFCPHCAVPLPASTNVAGEGAVAAGQVNAPTATQESIAAGGHVIVAGDGARVVIGEEPVDTSAVDHDDALARYLRHVIARNRYLRLQGIRSGGKLVSIELEQIYITLRATHKRTVDAKWLDEEAHLAPGEKRKRSSRIHTETVTVSVNEALAAERRLVVLGDPGSGKTTLLRYLALLYARDLAGQEDLVHKRLGLEETELLPVLIPLRRLGAYLKAHHPADDGTEGHALLLQHLRAMLKAERIELAADFFDPYLESGQAVILLDGLDEVADPRLRRRVSRMVEAFTTAYPDCRIVVTSRIVGYTGAARLGEGYATTTVRDFTDADIAQFLHNWHLAVAVGQMGAGASAKTYAENQTRQLLTAIQSNERIRELSINPLLLTVIALVHRDRVKLPDRRAELYTEAVDVLLGKWDEAKGTQEIAVLPNRPFDTGDKRLLLQQIALAMHEQQTKEITMRKLRTLLRGYFRDILQEKRDADRAVDRFLQVVEERTGLLVARGEGIYGFSHLTFQEYLAALAIAARDDYVAYTLERCADPWWREAILLTIGYLSLQSRERTSRLVWAIADCQTPDDPYHNLVLAAEALRDIGDSRVAGEIGPKIQRRLRMDLDTDIATELERRLPSTRWDAVWQRFRGESFDEQGVIRELIERKAAAMEALVRAGAGYWTQPYGEPEWVEIPAGEFWMGEGDNARRVHVDTFWIAKTPITNAQYQLFVKATDQEPPEHWEDDHPPKDRVSHPVVYVSWHDAVAYCQWLSEVTDKSVRLPSEAEWEKAARGDRDKRRYPWGDEFKATRCNSSELGLGETTPVGIFTAGASPYGVLDMAGNVLEWTRTHWQDNYDNYQPNLEVRNHQPGQEVRNRPVWRGGAFEFSKGYVQCAYRDWINRSYRHNFLGFRVVFGGPRPSAPQR